jgi:hypothetical protein
MSEQAWAAVVIVVAIIATALAIYFHEEDKP